MGSREPAAGLHDLSVGEAMSLWGELVEAYHGVNGFGGDTAELYAHRLGYEPAFAHLASHRERSSRVAAAVLGALLDRFIDVYDVSIVLDGVAYERGRKLVPFDHRVHVQVVPGLRARRAGAGRG